MKLESQTGRQCYIADAVEECCDGSDYDRGAIETAQQTARNTARLLGYLVQQLHESGQLTDEQVLFLVGWKFNKVEDE